MTQSGRSMVEMLGVLAVVGVISAGGLYGFNVAMKRHQANELMNEALKRAVTVASQIALGREPSDEANKSLIGEFTDPTDHEFKVKKANDKQFNMEISGVSEEVCEQMKNMAGNVIKEFEPETCSDDVTVKLTFNNDMGTADVVNGCTLTATDCLSGALVDGKCECAPADDETECTSWTTNECGTGKYCVFNPTGSGDDDHGKGVCKPINYIGGYKTTKVNNHEYTMSDSSGDLDWWTAQSWCKAFDKTMVSLSDLNCTLTECTGPLYKNLANALYQNNVWTTDIHFSFAWYVGLYNGTSFGISRNEGPLVSALCQ